MSAQTPPEDPLSFGERLAEFEADPSRRALAQTGGHKTKAAELLKMPLRTFMKRLKQYAIE